MTNLTVDLLQSREPLPEERPQASRRFTDPSRRLATLRAIPQLATWVGIGLIAVGLGLIVLAWGRTAALGNNVGWQVPYVISAGFSGVALVLVGLTVINIDVKRTESAERRRHLSELREVLAELRWLAEGEQP